MIGLSPLQQEYFDRLGGLVRNAGETGRGRVVFLAGDALSGRSFWFDAAARNLMGARVVAGGFAAGEYVPQTTNESRPLSEATQSLISAIAGVGPLFGLIAGLIGQLVTVSAAAYRFVDGLRANDQGFEIYELVPRLLRIAAAENAARPLACLIDDAD